MVQHVVKRGIGSLLVVLVILNHLWNANGIELEDVTGSVAEEDVAAIMSELLKVGSTYFDHQVLDHLDWSDGSKARDLNVSKTCFKHSCEYVTSIRKFVSPTKDDLPITPLWSLQMFDAMGKIPTGILEINTQWVGSFRECMNIKTKYQSDSFSGQYCTIYFENVTGTEDSKLANLLVRSETELGICWPSSCNETEIERVINYFEYVPLPVNRIVKSGFCQTDGPADFDAGTISVITLFLVFIVLVLAATIYDIFKRRRTRYQRLKVNDEDGENLKEAKPGICHKVLVCFSIYSNGKLISTAEDPSEKALGCIHGIRVFSMLWVIFMRVSDYATNMPIKDYKDVYTSIREWPTDIILSAGNSMDSMLFVSGFCVAYSLLYKLKNSGGRVKDFVRYYIHGFLRLTPVLAMTVAFVAGPWYLLASGPQWPQMKIMQTACQNDWWRTILYINNLFDTQNQCVETSWYTSLEMQFYVVAPLIIYPLYRWPIVGYVIGGLFCLATTLAPALLVVYKDLPGFPDTIVQFYPTDERSKDYNIEIFAKPYCRMGPYLVGIGLAYFLYRKDMKIKIKPIVLWIGWMSAVALALALVFGTFGYYALNMTMSTAMSAAYGALSRPAWGLCIAWIVLVNATGNAGYSGHFLSWRMFISLSHFTYSLYLVHLYVMLALFESYEGTMYYQNYMLAVLYVGILFLSIGIGSILYFLFEAPFVQLEKTFAPEDDLSSKRSSFAPEDDPPSKRSSTQST